MPPNDVTAGMRYLSHELRLELRAASEMLRRTILPPPAPPRGEVLQCLDAEIRPGRSIVLAQWKGEKGGDGCTIYGSRAPDQNSEFLPAEVSAQLQIRRGAVTRVERWPWPMAGFVRRLAAEEIVLSAVPYSAFATLQFYRLGASVQSGIVPADHVCIMGATNPVGVLSNQVFAPHGASAFKIADLSGLGTFQFAFENPAGTLAPALPDIPTSQVQDWVPWPANACGLVVTAGTWTTEFYV